MAYVRKYRPRWSKYVKDDDIEVKVLEFNKDKYIRSESLDITEANRYRRNEIFTDYYKEKYDEDIGEIEQVKDEDLLNLVSFNRINLTYDSLKELCKMLNSLKLAHFLNQIFSKLQDDIKLNINLIYDIINDYCKDEAILSKMREFVIKNSMILLKRQNIPFLSKSVLLYILQYKDSKILFHSEYMLCEMIFEWYHINSVNYDSYSGYTEILKELMKYINWNVLNLNKIHKNIVDLYINNSYYNSRCIEDIKRISIENKEDKSVTFRNRYYEGVKIPVTGDLYRILYDLNKDDFIVECGATVEHSMFYTNVIQNDKQSIDIFTSLLSLRHLFKFSLSLTLKESIIFSHYINKFNQFKEINKLSIWDSNLRDSNIIEYIIDIFNNLKYLDTINLYNDIITKDDMNIIFELLFKKTMKALWIRRCKLCDESVLYFIEKYETNNQNFDNYYYIDTVNFCDNNLTEASLIPLILFLRKQPNMKDLGLSNNTWNDEVITYFSLSLSFWSNMQALYLAKLESVSEEGFLLLFTSMINTCNKLKTLDISNNKITLIHAFALQEILKKGTLINVILQHCELNDEIFIAIIKYLKNNVNIDSIRIDHNIITDRGAFAFAEQVKTLRNINRLFLSSNLIGNDGINAICENLHYRKLQFLRIQDNYYDDDGLTKLGQTLGRFIYLREFFIGDKVKLLNSNTTTVNRNTKEWTSSIETEKGLAKLISHFFMFRLLLCLTIQDIEIKSDPLINELATVIKSNIHIKVLTLKHVFNGNNSILPIGLALMCLPELSELNLANNNLNDDNYCCIIKGLGKCSTELICLTLTNNRITDQGFIDSLDYFKELSNLQLIYLDKNQLGNNFAKQLSFLMITRFHSITHLNLASNQITELGAVALGAGIAELKNCFSVFSISNNSIKDIGLNGLCKGLYNNEQLKEFLVGQCDITEEGCLALCCVLRHGNRNRLIRLQMNLNNIGEKGTLGLGLSMKNLKYLESFGIMYNRVSFNSMNYMCKQILQYCPMMNNLYLSYNPLTEKEKTEIKELFKDSKVETLEI